MHLPANFFFSMNHFFNCQRIFGSESIIKCLQQVVGISELRAAGDAFANYLLLRQSVFIVPIVMRMNFVKLLVLLKIQLPRCFIPKGKYIKDYDLVQIYSIEEWCNNLSRKI